MPNNIRSFVPWIAAGIMALAIGFYFRLFPLTHDVASDAYEQGTMLVISRLRSAIALQVERQEPGLPPSGKERLIKEQFDKNVREHAAELRLAFDRAGQEILASSGDTKHYLLDPDSFYFYALTEELLQKGRFGGEHKGGKYFNNKMMAPLGYWQPENWHPYVGLITYKLVRFFKPDADLMFAVAFGSMIMVPLVLAAFFFACRVLGCTVFPSFIAGTFFLLAPIYLKRSTFAWFRNDAYNIFFPLLMLAFVFLAIDNLHRIKRALVFCALAAAAIALHARFWEGWGAIWGLGAVSCWVVAGTSLLKERAVGRNSLILAITATALPFIMVGLSFGLQETINIIAFAGSALQRFLQPSLKGWPDLFLMVGELKQATWGEVMELTGGPILFLGAFLALGWGLGCSLVRYTRNTPKLMTLGVFLAATLFLSLGAQRFSLLCLVPLSLLFAWGLNELYVNREGIQQQPGPRSGNLKKMSRVILSGVLLVSLVFPIGHANSNIRKLLSPIFNSTWERILTQIRDKTPENSIINSWWSPGHFIKAIAKRRVTFDGATINGEQGYWMNRVYLSQTEEEALGILRMLNVSSNKATEYLQAKGLPLSVAVPLLREATRLDKKNACELYRQKLSQPDADTLIALTHGNPPPSYMLIYQEIVEGNVLLGYLGKWDFRKIEALNNNPELLKKVPSKGSKEYIDFLWAMVGGPYRQSATLNPVAREGSMVRFDQGITINTSTMTATVDSPQFGHGIPKSLFYVEDGKIQEKTFPGASLSYSIVLFADNKEPRCVLMDRILANSLVVKLYYLNGSGLTHFKPFARERDLSGRTKIFVYQVDW